MADLPPDEVYLGAAYAGNATSPVFPGEQVDVAAEYTALQAAFRAAVEHVWQAAVLRDAMPEAGQWMIQYGHDLDRRGPGLSKLGWIGEPKGRNYATAQRRVWLGPPELIEWADDGGPPPASGEPDPDS